MDGLGRAGGLLNSDHRSVENVFRDFKGRRAGLIKAFTCDVERFYRKCDPIKDDLCLFGSPDENWEVNFPAQEVPAEFPEPVLGINCARDTMEKSAWLCFVAKHSDLWLLSVAFFIGTKFGFQKADRSRLFSKINNLPTIYEIVLANSKKKSKAKSSVSNDSSNKSNSGSKGQFSGSKYNIKPMPKDEEEALDEEDYEEHGETLCGACMESYAPDEFWICCDICDQWFHGKCVRITPSRAEHIKQYKCPLCRNKRARH